MALTFSIGLAVLAGLCCVGRALILFIIWRPAAATLWASDYGEAERHADRSRALWDGENVDRPTMMTVMFEDEDGIRRRSSVSASVRRGTMPDGSFVIWYDPDDPGRATRDGPLWWLSCAAGAWAGAVALFQTATHLPR